MNEEDVNIALGCGWVGFVCLGALMTHIIHSYLRDEWVALVGGTVFPPWGIIHGFWLWVTHLLNF